MAKNKYASRVPREGGCRELVQDLHSFHVIYCNRPLVEGEEVCQVHKSARERGARRRKENEAMRRAYYLVRSRARKADGQ
jgi:hypothetical protein